MDKTTGKNIIWATDSYSDRGKGYQRDQQMLFEQVIRSGFLQPRILKSLDVQKERTKKNAEVYTPAWICNLMNNQIDQDWFEDQEGFNQQEDKNWITNPDHVSFLNKDKKTWKEYVSRKVLEITCGEAPYLVSRYDSSTGNPIDIKDRVGLFDRKLRVVTENTNNFKDWYKWALKALKSIYGYEFQGDSLLIGRVNVYLTLLENAKEIWNQDLTVKQQEQIADIICWNLFQMDGLTDCIPVGAPADQFVQPSLFDFFETEQTNDETTSPPVKINWWDKKARITMREMKEGIGMSKRKFSVVIGNPPYQGGKNESNPRQDPVYQLFYEATETITRESLLITPARFLFNAGLTSKEWNKKMLTDKHLKVINYFPDGKDVFPNTEIKGGVAVVYRNFEKYFDPVEVFIPEIELRSINTKVRTAKSRSLSEIIHGGRSDLLLSEEALNTFPQIKDDRLKVIQAKNGKVNKLAKNEEFEIKSSAFSVLPYLFSDSKLDDDSFHILGLAGSTREWRWIPKKYTRPRNEQDNNLACFKVLIPKASGTGKFGEKLSEPLLAKPDETSTPTFISLGKFQTLSQAQNAQKYIKTKFARALLGILKITQDIVPSKWKYVPLQDFTDNSDIDWSKSIPEIDQQLYKKYGLSPEEIEFIETHVKEME